MLKRWILLSLVILVIAGIGIYRVRNQVLQRRPHTAQPQATVQPSDEEWGTYISPIGNFSLKYPPTHVIMKHDDGVNIGNTTDPTIVIQFSNFDEPSGYCSPKTIQFPCLLAAEASPQQKLQENLTIGGKKARSMLVAMDSTGLPYHVVLVESTPKMEFRVMTAKPETEELFEKMLSSLQFTQ